MTSGQKITADWIAADWGSTRLRVWAMKRSGAPLASASAPLGMNRLTPRDYEPALLGLIAPWLADGRRTPVLLCGMVGAQQGWRPAPYGELPADPAQPSPPVAAPALDPRLDARILPGLRQLDPPDVMRGEETLIAGFLAASPGFEGMVVLPGTHSKWARLRGGRLERFATYMTGELFALLAETSMLRHSVAGEGWSEEDFAHDAFGEGLADAVATPAKFSSHLFALRAAHLLRDARPQDLRARLSGLVIGLECAGALAETAPDALITVIADGAVAERYVRALGLLGRAAGRFGAEDAGLAGLSAAYHALAAQGEWT